MVESNFKDTMNYRGVHLVLFIHFDLFFCEDFSFCCLTFIKVGFLL